MAQVTKAVGEMSNMVLTIVMYALVLGSILGTAAFTAITIINVTSLSATYGTAVTALVAFLTVSGTIIGILFLIKYVVQLFDKKKGMGNITA
jgi:hypothetical protein